MTEQLNSALLPVLQKGDLLFQLRKGGEPEWATSRLFAGYNGMALNHVAMATGSGELVEAVRPEIQTITLTQFIDQSVCDGLGRPCILVARLKASWLPLVDKALAFADEQLHIDRSCYCSTFVLEAFRLANKGEPVFLQTGESGSHPALLSCSDKLDVIRVVGQLPARQIASEQLA